MGPPRYSRPALAGGSDFDTRASAKFIRVWRKILLSGNQPGACPCEKVAGGKYLFKLLEAAKGLAVQGNK
jgi:hypothetical protein